MRPVGIPSISGFRFYSERPACEWFEVAVTGTRVPCGNGTIEAGQECDDGNSDPGDGCDQFCRVEACHTCSGEPSVCVPQADGTVCSDGDGCTTGDTCMAGSCQGTPLACGTCESCDPASGTCTGAPRPACRASTAVQKSILKLRNSTPDAADLGAIGS